MIGYGNSVFLRTAWEVSSGVPPVNTVAPAITGTAQEGQTVTCSTGTWTGTPTITFAYQWKRNGSNIGSATNSTYVLVTADVAQSITCEVTATNGSGSASATSNTITPIAVLLLDAYSGAAIAYSLRKLRSAYSGSAIRVRRSSDNAEQNIGFVSDVLDTASLLTFCGAGNGFITTWYDQSGSANNFIQTTVLSQPQIVASGAVININSKPSLRFNSKYMSNSATGTPPADLSVFTVRNMATYPNTFRSLFTYKQYGLTYNSAGGAGFGTAHIYSNTAYTTFNNYPTTNGQAIDFLYNRLNLERNNFAATIATNSAGYGLAPSVIGSFSGAIQFFDGEIQEFIIYETNQNTNKVNIKSNINTFYTVY
jgi:hypothetical protein